MLSMKANRTRPYLNAGMEEAGGRKDSPSRSRHVAGSGGGLPLVAKEAVPEGGWWTSLIDGIALWMK